MGGRAHPANGWPPSRGASLAWSAGDRELRSVDSERVGRVKEPRKQLTWVPTRLATRKATPGTTRGMKESDDGEDCDTGAARAEAKAAGNSEAPRPKVVLEASRDRAHRGQRARHARERSTRNPGDAAASARAVLLSEGIRAKREAWQQVGALVVPEKLGQPPERPSGGKEAPEDGTLWRKDDRDTRPENHLNEN